MRVWSGAVVLALAGAAHAAICALTDMWVPSGGAERAASAKQAPLGAWRTPTFSRHTHQRCWSVLGTSSACGSSHLGRAKSRQAKRKSAAAVQTRAARQSQPALVAASSATPCRADETESGPATCFAKEQRPKEGQAKESCGCANARCAASQASFAAHVLSDAMLRREGGRRPSCSLGGGAQARKAKHTSAAAAQTQVVRRQRSASGPACPAPSRRSNAAKAALSSLLHGGEEARKAKRKRDAGGQTRRRRAWHWPTVLRDCQAPRRRPGATPKPASLKAVGDLTAAQSAYWSVTERGNRSATRRAAVADVHHICAMARQRRHASPKSVSAAAADAAGCASSSAA